MTSKQTGLLLLALTIAISPILATAEGRGDDLNKSTIPEKSKPEDNKELRKEFDDARRSATSTNRASSTEDRKRVASSTDRIFLIKTRTIQSAENIIRKTEREISKLKNLITRLSGTDSIIEKLEAKGVNTSAIKAKLGEATTAISSAESNLAEARNIILTAKDPNASSTTQTAQSIKNLKAKVINIRQSFEQAKINIKVALGKIKDARRMIKEIPGIREIEKSTVASSTAQTN